MICRNCQSYAPDANYKCPNCKAVLDKSHLPPPTEGKKPTRSLGRYFTFIILVAFIGFFIFEFIYVSDSESDSSNAKKITKQTEAGINRDSQQQNSDTDTDDYTEPAYDDSNDSNNSNDSDDVTSDDFDNDSPENDTPENNAPENNTVTTPNPLSNYPPAHIINSNNPGQVIDIEKYVQLGKTTIFDFYSEFCPPCRQIAPYLKKLDILRPDIVVLKVDINRPGVRGIDWRSPAAQHFNLRSIPHFVIYSPNRQRTHEGRSAYQEINRLMQLHNIIR